MEQLIKINKKIASPKTISLHLGGRICLKGKACYTKGQFCTQSTYFPSAAKPPNNMVILMSNRGTLLETETGSFFF